MAVLACLLLAAGAAAANHRAPSGGQGTAVLLAARDLAAGTVLTPRDVATAHWAPSQLPAAAIVSVAGAVGRVVGAAMYRGEPFTAARLQGPGLAAGLGPALVAVTVSLTGPQGAAILQPGDTVDLLAGPADLGAVDADESAAGDGARQARVVVTAARVLAVLHPPGNIPKSDDSTVVVALTRTDALP